MCTWHFGIWFSRQGVVGLTIRLDDLSSLFQPMILRWFSRQGVVGLTIRLDDLSSLFQPMILRFYDSVPMIHSMYFIFCLSHEIIEQNYGCTLLKKNIIYLGPFKKEFNNIIQFISHCLKNLIRT